MLKSVKSRLTFLFLSLMAVLLTLFCGSLYLWIRRALSRELDQKVRLELRLVQEDVANGNFEPAVGRDVHVTIRRADGGVVFSSGPSLPGDSHFRLEIEGVQFRGKTARVVRATEEFQVALAVSEADMRNQLREVLFYFAVFIPILVVLSWVAGLLFVGRTLLPLEQIRRQAELISRAKLDERVPEPEVGTEFKRLARTFNEMLDRLEKAFEDLQCFAADAAHELRTPLANLRAELETTIQQRGSAVPDPLLASLAEEIHRMNRIVTDLLTLAKLDLRQYALKKELVALAPILREVCDTWSPLAAERKISIAVGECADAPVDGDAVALRRVLMNLVENAVKYNREGGRVDLTLRRENGAVRLDVADTGPGIPPEHLPLLFRRFYRVDKARSRDTGGAGLGLAICKSFVEAHEGEISVKSALGEGTTFTVKLPAAR